MARPITWQDVSRPVGMAAAIEMFGRGGDRLAQAVQGIGQVAVDNRNQQIEAKTKEAVAEILTSKDPTATAAAVPQDDWRIDPLAIANAAQQREGDLLKSRAAEQTIRASQAQIRASDSAVLTQEANRKDIEDKRRGAELAQPYLDQILAGKFKGVGPDAFKDQGQGGIYAQEAIQQALKDQRDFQLRASETNARIRALNEQKVAQDFMGWAREFGASAEGQLLDAKELDRRLVAEAKRRGVSVALVDQASGYYEKGAMANGATDAELKTKIPGENRTYADAMGVLTQVKTGVENQISAALAAPIRPNDPTAPSILQLKELAERGPGFQDGNIGFVASELAAKADISESSARERISEIRKQYPYLNHAQSADLAFQSKDRWTAIGFDVSKAPEVRVGAMLYREVDKLGGKEGIDRLAGQITAPLQATLAKIPGEARRLSGSARTGTGLSPQILEWDAALATKRRETAAQEEQAAAEAAARALELEKLRNRQQKERY